MAKGYWIGHVTITDPSGYPEYVAANAEAFARYGGRFVVRGGKAEVVEGTSRDRHVVIEFPSYQQAIDCYRSPEYERALALRQKYAVADLIIVEGID